MTAQEQNAELVDLMSVYFVPNDNPAYAWGQACAGILALPALRAFWPMSSVDYATASRARDIAGGGYHLSDNNTVTFGYDQLAPYAEFDGVNQYLSRADGGAANWADIRGNEAYVVAAQRGLTLGGWFRYNAVPGITEGMMAKDAANPQRGYTLQRIAAGTVRWGVSVDGAAFASVDSSSTPAVSSWFFAAGRFVPSTSLDIFIDTDKDSNVAAIPATVFDNTTIFTVGARGVPTNYLDGSASLCFLCAAALSDSLIGTIYQQTRRLFQRT